MILKKSRVPEGIASKFFQEVSSGLLYTLPDVTLAFTGNLSAVLPEKFLRCSAENSLEVHPGTPLEFFWEFSRNSTENYPAFPSQIPPEFTMIPSEISPPVAPRIPRAVSSGILLEFLQESREMFLQESPGISSGVLLEVPPKIASGAPPQSTLGDPLRMSDDSITGSSFKIFLESSFKKPLRLPSRIPPFLMP